MGDCSDEETLKHEKNMVNNCAQRIKVIASLTFIEAKMLYDTIQECQLQDAYKKILREALDAKLSLPNTEDDSNVVLKPQVLTAINNYLTKTEWLILTDHNSSLGKKASTIARRLRLVGVKSLHEQTAKYAVALMLTTLTQLPSYNVIHQMLQEFKQVFHRDLTKMQVPFVRNYPNTVEELPEAISQAAYSQEDPAAPREVENLVLIAENHIPLRGTSKLLKKETAVPDEIAKDKKQPAEKNAESNLQTMVPAMGSPFGEMGAMGQFAIMMMQMCKQQQMGMGQGNEAKVTLSPKKEKELEEQKKAKAALNSAAAAFKPQERQLALLDSETNEESKEEVATAATAADTALEKKKTPEEFEKATFEALKAKKDSKKGKAKEKSMASNPKGKAKGKAKNKVVMKKPSAKTLQYEIPPWTLKDMHVDKNTYTSRHWHAARSFAKRTFAMDEAESKIYAKSIRDAAAQIYDEHVPPRSPRKDESILPLAKRSMAQESRKW